MKKYIFIIMALFLLNGCVTLSKYNNAIKEERNIVYKTGKCEGALDISFYANWFYYKQFQELAEYTIENKDISKIIEKINTMEQEAFDKYIKSIQNITDFYKTYLQ